VGGAVRDALLGHPHLDWDFATSATPDQVRTVFGRKRTIPVGIAFGTVGVLDDKNVMHEVTTFRRDVRTDGRHAEVEFGVSLDDDLARRDYTINAIAFSPTKGEVRDPFDGRGDLERRIVRAVGVAADRMKEDRLRALRGLRFAARLGFTIETATMTAIRESAPFLNKLSGERVRQEIEKTMDQVAAPSGAIAMWRESGAAGALVPELAGGEAERALDCSAVPGLARRPGRRLTRLAILVSDVPAAAVHVMAMRLRFSKQDAQWLADLSGSWQALDGPMAAAMASGSPTPADVRRWIARIGRPRLPSFFRLASARWSARRASGKAPSAAAVSALYRRSLRASLTEPVDLHDLKIDGDDLRAAGVQPGPRLGKTLHVLLDRVLENPALNTRDGLLAAAKELLDDDE
jgi:tRNA nucleotidyltransferase (CCA-adding enzyme)